MKTVYGVSFSLIVLLFLGCQQVRIDIGSPPLDDVDTSATTTAHPLKLVPIYQTQFRIFQHFPSDTAQQAQLILDSLYYPNRHLLTDCFGYSPSDYVAAQRTIYADRMLEVEQALAYYEQVNFDSLLTYYQQNFAQLTQQRVGGRFHFAFFEKKICNFCGCTKETMQMDLLAPVNQNIEQLRILLPHELSHNAFEDAQNDTSMVETVLYKAIDEGFANYVSQQLAEVSTPEAFGLSPEEYDWYVTHEEAIKQKVKPLLLSQREEDWDPLGLLVADSFMEGSPGNIGYYVGYRIVEEYLKRIGTENWRQVYTTPVAEIYQISEW